MRSFSNAVHTLRVLFALAPLALSIRRDFRRWLWWGAPLQRSPEFHQRRAQKLVRCIATLGATFVKGAQVYATRADLIPEPYLSALGTLVDQVPPVPWQAIADTIRAELGQDAKEIFEHIDERPIASASLGQVHRAKWKGRDVAVKVLRPRVEVSVARDIAAARWIIARLKTRWPIPHVLGFHAMIEEFALRIVEEMDYRLEAEYATEVRKNFAENKRLVIPEVMHELTRTRVLVTEYIEGVRVDRLPPLTKELDRLAPLVLETYVQMMLVDGLFHADPHSGNLLWTADARLVLLDFGMMVRVPKQLRLALIRTVFAAIRRDATAVAEGFHTLGLVAPRADGADIQRLAEILVAMSEKRTTTKERLDWMLTEGVMKSLYDFPVILPRDLVYFARTAALIEGLGTRYDPYFNAVQVGTPIVLRLRSRILTSLGEEANPSLEEIASAAGWAVGRAWRKVQEMFEPWRGVAGVLGAALLLALAPQDANAQDPIHDSVAAVLRDEGLVGATWALVTPEGVRVGAAGLANATTREPMRADHRVQVGSVTKAVLALGVLRLVSEGRLDLDVPLDSITRAFRIANPWWETHPVRLRHLLDHTGGIDDARMSQLFTRRATPDSKLQSDLSDVAGGLRARIRPGTRFSYSNTAYTALGLIIEQRTHERYEVYLDTAILRPLGMTASTFEFVSQVGDAADSTLAMGHFENGVTAAAVPSRVRSAGQFTTTVGDMAKLARFLMSDGRVDGRMLIDSSLLNARGRDFRSDASRAGLHAGYALGWMRRDRHGVVAGCHDGNIVGYFAQFCVIPEEQKAFFISLNADVEGADYSRFDRILLDELKASRAEVTPVATPGIDPSEWNGFYLRRPVRIQQFAYLDETFNVTRVRWRDDTLWLAPFQGEARALMPVGGALFRAADRATTSHIAFVDSSGATVIADGFRTYERVSIVELALRWLSLVIGIVSALGLIVSGLVREFRARRQRRGLAIAIAAEVVASSTTVVFLVLAARSFDFLALGDPSWHNFVIAAVCVIAAFKLVRNVWRLPRRSAWSFATRVELTATVGALQWCLVLAWWGLFPLLLWR